MLWSAECVPRLKYFDTDWITESVQLFGFGFFSQLLRCKNARLFVLFRLFFRLNDGLR